MKRLFTVVLLVGCITGAAAQSYKDSIAKHREHYIKELLEDKRAPIKPHQAKDIHFFAADPAYRVWAEVKETPGSQPFMIPTRSGKQKPFREYATLTFKLKGENYVLHAYQGIDLIKDTAYNNYLFIPFRDQTNYESTYGGGRYIDLSINDIVNGRIVLDFNKCYNPYCAYADGFNCPIPPSENSLQIDIPAGEKTFIH